MNVFMAISFKTIVAYRYLFARCGPLANHELRSTPGGRPGASSSFTINKPASKLMLFFIVSSTRR